MERTVEHDNGIMIVTLKSEFRIFKDRIINIELNGEISRDNKETECEVQINIHGIPKNITVNQEIINRILTQRDLFTKIVDEFQKEEDMIKTARDFINCGF